MTRVVVLVDRLPDHAAPLAVRALTDGSPESVHVAVCFYADAFPYRTERRTIELPDLERIDISADRLVAEAVHPAWLSWNFDVIAPDPEAPAIAPDAPGAGAAHLISEAVQALTLPGDARLSALRESGMTLAAISEQMVAAKRLLRRALEQLEAEAVPNLRAD